MTNQLAYLWSPLFSHVNDGLCIAMAKPAVPGFNVRNSCVEGSCGDGNFGLLMVLDIWSFCRENVEVFQAGENAANKNCVAFVGDPAPIRIEVGGVVAAFVESEYGNETYS
jgi:hypothetical protein